MRFSKRSKINSFIVMDVMEQARKEELLGRDIVHMEVGQPGTPAPRNAIKELTKKINSEPLGYTVALGIPELRRKISNLYKDWYGLDINPDRVIVTSGSSGAFILAFTSLFDTSDKVGIGAPGYPSYKQILKALDIEPVIIETSLENKFQLSPKSIISHELDGLLVASPANPTGSMLDLSELTELINNCHNNNISFISDEIYHGIEYHKKAISALEITDDCYVINSFSKYFSMTGWRIGWMVVPENHIRQVERLAQNMFICAPHSSQIAALGALSSGKELRENLEVYKINRELLIDGLKKAGFDKFAPPDGAFYVYADISQFSSDSLSFCKSMLEKAGVAITPGLDFDSKRGKQTIRFSYARTTDEIKEGIKRIIEFMDGYSE